MNSGLISFPGWFTRPRVAIQETETGLFTVDPDFITTSAPKILWIELSSKCPFDCIFCTRRVRFGAGRYLDFALYEKLIAELDRPDFIGLNYSGESIYYPKLLEAIALANATGASTELVTAFSTITPTLLRRIVESGLDRLAVSLHTMDPDQYKHIYKLGSLDLLRQRVDDFFEWRAKMNLQKPRLEFCFVAMSENLDQLPKVASYVHSLGIPELSIHPIIGRHLIPHDFSTELSANQLRSGFKDKLRSSVAEVQNAHPGFTVNVLNPDLDPSPALSHSPGYFSPLSPSGARILSCDQSPFESVHILASGNVVVCEVHDEVSLGNLADQSLRQIWHSERYRDFRRNYVDGAIPECRSCVWKQAYLPDVWQSSILVSDGMSPQLIRGWHAHEGSGTIWSKKQSLIALSNPKLKKRLRLTGTLPHAFGSQSNTLEISCNKGRVGEIDNPSSSFYSFDITLNLPQIESYLYIDLTAGQLYRPSLFSASGDSRDLGFGLQKIEVCD